MFGGGNLKVLGNWRKGGLLNRLNRVSEWTYLECQISSP